MSGRKATQEGGTAEQGLQTRPDPGGLGPRIRNLRRDKGMSLVSLGEASGIPTSTLAKFETNELSIPVDRLYRLCDVLGVSVTDFFDRGSVTPSDSALGRRSVRRLQSGFQTTGANYDCTWLFSDLSQKLMFPGLQTLKARTMEEFGPLLRHEGEEFALVLEGKVQVVTEIYEPEILGPMDGIYIDSRMGHAFLNGGEGLALILNVSTDAKTKELALGLPSAPRRSPSQARRVRVR